MELDLRRFLNRRRLARFRVIRRQLAVCRGGQSHCALRIVPPAVWIGVFFADMAQSSDLVFQTCSVTLVDNRRGNEDQQVAFMPLITVTLKCIADTRNISKNWHLRSRLARLVGD